MTRRQWSVIIVLVILNYIVFNILIRQLLSSTSRPVAIEAATPQPTFTATVYVATLTPRPTNTRVLPPSTPTPLASPTPEATLTPTETPSPLPTAIPPPTRRPATATLRPPSPPTATNTPAPTATPTFQFIGEVIWDPLVAPNCAGPAVSKLSIIRDAAGNPINDAQVEMDCYGNVWLSHPSGRPGEYDPGHYDFSLGAIEPKAWTCTLRMHNVGGVPVASSQVVTVVFDTNDCRPDGVGHQVAIVHWRRQW